MHDGFAFLSQVWDINIKNAYSGQDCNNSVLARQETAFGKSTGRLARPKRGFIDCERR